MLILDEPTRGVDVGAKSEIYRIIDDLAKAGAGVLVISSELAEVVGIADRVIVMREGHLEGEVTGDDIDQENIIALATAAKRDVPSTPVADGFRPGRSGAGRPGRGRPQPRRLAADRALTAFVQTSSQ